MSREYARREDNGKRILLEIVCDSCGAKIIPNPDIRYSGWIKQGYETTPGNWTIFDYCPNCH